MKWDHATYCNDIQFKTHQYIIAVQYMLVPSSPQYNAVIESAELNPKSWKHFLMNNNTRNSFFYTQPMPVWNQVGIPAEYAVHYHVMQYQLPVYKGGWQKHCLSLSLYELNFPLRFDKWLSDFCAFRFNDMFHSAAVYLGMYFVEF